MLRVPRNPRGAKAFLLILFSTIAVYLLFHHSSQAPRIHFVPHQWKSDVSGWYNRSTIVNDTSHIHFTSLFDFQLLHTTSTWGSEHLGVAFFDEDYCITPKAVLKMDHQDYVGITQLIAIVRARNSVKRRYVMNTQVHDMTTFSIHVAGQDGHSKLYSAYGFDRMGADSGASWMPEELWQLFGLVSREEVGELESDGEDFTRLKEELGGLIRGMKNVGKHYGPGDDH